MGLLLFLDVPENGDGRFDVARHALAPGHGLQELAERHGDAAVQDALLHLLGDLELLLRVAFADEGQAQTLDLLVEWPAELGAVAAASA